jgi:4,5-DOPA dioxygenase extradiol
MARSNGDRGLDHGAWVPLMYLVPDASLPVFQVSMPLGLDVAGAYQMGQLLAPLRDQGVIILASGSLTHNLGEFRLGPRAAQPYVTEFVDWVKDTLVQHDDDRMLAYRETAPHATRAHPSDDHFLPLLVAMGARNHQDAFSVIEGGVTYGFLSMDSFAWQ